MTSPVKSCRSIASGTLPPSSKHNNVAGNSDTDVDAEAGDVEIDLSHLVEAHFDNAAAISSKDALVQDAMKRRFGKENNNALAPTTPAAAGRSNATTATDTDTDTDAGTDTDTDTDTSRNANVNVVVPDTPGSFPSVGLSVNGMMMS